ncbi:MAG: hypothetical protein JEZ00_06995 [Anaerolineaceae bacterium]|nr:hypothetical protein [Anaerolineaceae bacterium]
MTPYEPKIRWNLIYRLGAISAIGAILVGIAEIGIQFIPEASNIPETISGWFALYQENWFLGLRNMGLLNICLNLFAILTYFGLMAAHRKTDQYPYALLAMILSYLGIATFLATNRAFPMWDLSRQYLAAYSQNQQTLLEAAGQAMLVIGGSHSPGTYLSFFLVEVAGVLISWVMLRSDVFGKLAAISGMAGFATLLVFETLTSFGSGLTMFTMSISMIGGLLSMFWYILIARSFLRMAKQPFDL